MKKLIILMMISQFFMLSKGQSTDLKQLSSLEFNGENSRNKGILLDVRTSNEFNNGHLPDAGQLNFYSLDFKKRLLMLPKDEPIYLYCNTGYRSEKAGQILIETS